MDGETSTTPADEEQYDVFNPLFEHIMRSPDRGVLLEYCNSFARCLNIHLLEHFRRIITHLIQHPDTVEQIPELFTKIRDALQLQYQGPGFPSECDNFLSHPQRDEGPPSTDMELAAILQTETTRLRRDPANGDFISRTAPPLSREFADPPLSDTQSVHQAPPSEETEEEDGESLVSLSKPNTRASTTTKRPRPHTSENSVPDPKPKQARTYKVNRPLTKTKKLVGPGDFAKLSLNISHEVSIEKLHDVRDRFCAGLLKLRKPSTERPPTVEGQVPESLFDQAQAVKLSEFFFVNTFGADGYEQISQFVHDYKPAADQDEIDMGAANRLRAVAGDPSAPPTLQAFCACLSADLTYHQGKTSKYTHLREMLRARKMFQTYEQVCTKIDDRQQAMEQYFQIKVGHQSLDKIKRAARTSTQSGVSYTSVAIDVLAAVIDIPRNKLMNRIDRCRALDHVLKKIGNGFLLLMPPSSISFLREMSISRLGPACDLFLRLCPWATDLTLALQSHVLEPWEQGVVTLPFNFKYFGPRPEGEAVFFMEAIMSAVKQQGSLEQTG